MKTSRDPIIQWLMQGDPAIRWQVQRDLLDAKPGVCERERKRVEVEGWGARILNQQDATGTWANGLYSPKWTSTTYTLLLLRHYGLPQDNPQACKACALLAAKGIYRDGGINLFKSIDYSETCVNGMMLALLSYFRHPDQSIVDSVVHFLIGDQMDDGGWNCERIKGATHASFHTTLSVLEGLREYELAQPEKKKAIKSAVQRAHEFLLRHRLYHSHHTGRIADPAMARIYFPPRWRYDFLRALDYFQSIDAPKDDRMQDAIALLIKKQTPDGRWKQNANWAGRTFFEMEKVGQPGRWNTLRALRVLKWWEAD
jgi:hypothetical protein